MGAAAPRGGITRLYGGPTSGAAPVSSPGRSASSRPTPSTNHQCGASQNPPPPGPLNSAAARLNSFCSRGTTAAGPGSRPAGPAAPSPRPAARSASLTFSGHRGSNSAASDRSGGTTSTSTFRGVPASLAGWRTSPAPGPHDRAAARLRSSAGSCWPSDGRSAACAGPGRPAGRPEPDAEPTSDEPGDQPRGRPPRAAPVIGIVSSGRGGANSRPPHAVSSTVEHDQRRQSQPDRDHAGGRGRRTPAGRATARHSTAAPSHPAGRYRRHAPTPPPPGTARAPPPAGQVRDRRRPYRVEDHDAEFEPRGGRVAGPPLQQLSSTATGTNTPTNVTARSPIHRAAGRRGRACTTVCTPTARHPVGNAHHARPASPAHAARAAPGARRPAGCGAAAAGCRGGRCRGRTAARRTRADLPRPHFDSPVTHPSGERRWRAATASRRRPTQRRSRRARRGGRWPRTGRRLRSRR